MSKFIANNESNPNAVAIEGKYCRDFFSRFLGLMFKKKLGSQEGILLDQGTASRMGSSIHMFFMHFDLAVIWLDSDHLVVDLTLAKKWKPFYAPATPARFVIETHVDNIQNFHTGDQLNITYED